MMVALRRCSERRAGVEGDLRQSLPEEEDSRRRSAKADVSPEAVELIINSVSYQIREHADPRRISPHQHRASIHPEGRHRQGAWPPAGHLGSPRPDRLDPGGDGSRDAYGEAPRRLRGGAFVEAT